MGSVSNSLLSGISTMAVIVGIVFFLLLIFMLIVKIKKEESLEKLKKNSKLDVLLIGILNMVLLVIDLLSIVVMPSNINFIWIFGIIIQLIVIALLFFSYKNYKKDQLLEGAKFEKIIAIALITKNVFECIMLFILLVAFKLPIATILLKLIDFVVILKLYIPLFLLFDTIKIEKKLKEEQNLTSNNNPMIYIICVIVIIIYMILSYIPVYNAYKKLEELGSMVKRYTSINNSEGNIFQNIIGAENNFDNDLNQRTNEALYNYAQSRAEENAMLNNLMSYVDQILESNESNTVSENSLSNNSVGNSYVDLILPEPSNNSNSININNNSINIGNNSIGVNNNSINIDNNSISINNNNQQNKIIGDVNSDGKLSMSDLALLQKYFVDKDATNLSDITLLDINGDGNITMSDISMLKQKIVGVD